MPAVAKKKKAKKVVKPEPWAKGYDFPVEQMEQPLQGRFEKEIDFTAITSDRSAMALYKQGPVSLDNFEQAVYDLFKAIKADKKIPTESFFISQHPKVIGKVTAEGIKVIVYVYGRWH